MKRCILIVSSLYLVFAVFLVNGQEKTEVIFFHTGARYPATMIEKSFRGKLQVRIDKKLKGFAPRFFGLRDSGKLYFAQAWGQGDNKVEVELKEIHLKSDQNEIGMLRNAVPNETTTSYQGEPQQKDLDSRDGENVCATLRDRGEFGIMLLNINPKQFYATSYRFPNGQCALADWPYRIQQGDSIVYRFKAGEEGWTHFSNAGTSIRWDTRSLAGYITEWDGKDGPKDLSAREWNPKGQYPLSTSTPPAPLSGVIVQKTKMRDGTWWITVQIQQEPPGAYDPTKKAKVKIISAK